MINLISDGIIFNIGAMYTNRQHIFQTLGLVLTNQEETYSMTSITDRLPLPHHLAVVLFFFFLKLWLLLGSSLSIISPFPGGIFYELSLCLLVCVAFQL